MRTWSLERVVVEVLGRAAVAAQGVLDALWPPNFPAQANDFPIPGCPDAGECRTYGCAGDCSEATEARDDYQAVSPDGYYGHAEPHLADTAPKSSPPASAGVPENSPGQVSGHSAVPPCPGRPNWADWATPAVLTVLCDHFPYYDDDAAMYECVDDMGCAHASFGDVHAWREHVAPLIAQWIDQAQK